MEREIVVIAHNIRSAHNVGSLLRTCEGLGISKVFLSGYTPYPSKDSDPRMPHIYKKVTAQIEKTSLGAEKTLVWEQHPDIQSVLSQLKSDGFKVVALEQDSRSIKLTDYEPPQKVALLLGSEVTGVDKDLLAQADEIVEIPMLGQKESFNVVQAAAMALSYCRFIG